MEYREIFYERKEKMKRMKQDKKYSMKSIKDKKN